MAGPAPAYQPAFSEAQVAECQALIRRQSAPQAQVYRAKLALLLHARPRLDNEAAGRALGKHANWVRYWRKRWATEGFRLADRAGRGRKPVFPPSAGGAGQGVGVRAPRAA
jgi:hypothetical protein